MPIQLIHLDHALYLWVVTHRLGLLTPAMRAASVVGRGGTVWLAAGAILTVAGRIRPSGLLQVVLAILLASVVADDVFKPLIGRERPFVSTPRIEILVSRPRDASLPSGHAANAFAGAFVLSRLVPPARILWWLMALVIACSRVYLGVHYPLDVIAGAAVGLVCGITVQRTTAHLLHRIRGDNNDAMLS